VRRNLVILLLIISTITILGVTYWFFRPEKRDNQTATVQAEEPQSQKEPVTQQEPVLKPMAQENPMAPLQAEPAGKNEQLATEPIDGTTTKAATLVQAPEPTVAKLPKPEDSVLASLMKDVDQKSLNLRTQTIATVAPLKVLIPEIPSESFRGVLPIERPASAETARETESEPESILDSTVLSIENPQEEELLVAETKESGQLEIGMGASEQPVVASVAETQAPTSLGSTASQPVSSTATETKAESSAVPATKVATEATPVTVPTQVTATTALETAKTEQVATAKAEQEAKTPAAASDIPSPIENEDNLEMTLSVSFFDRQLEDFSKGIQGSVDLMTTGTPLSLGGSLQAGLIQESSDRFYASLLGKITWTLGKGTVTFPLSISLGPTAFFDFTNPITWGFSSEAMAGIKYMLTDTFGLFTSVGITYQAEFASTFESHWIVQPLKLGVTIKF
jgi:hypothetical protein